MYHIVPEGEAVSLPWSWCPGSQMAHRGALKAEGPDKQQANRGALYAGDPGSQLVHRLVLHAGGPGSPLAHRDKVDGRAPDDRLIHRGQLYAADRQSPRNEFDAEFAGTAFGP
jgi:hypothetical protein